MRRGALALVATLAVALAGCGGGRIDGADRTRPSPAPTATDPVTHAQAEAHRLLGLVHVPADARSADDSPTQALDQPAQSTATDDLVDVHRWWTLSWDAQKTTDWLTAHGVERLKSSGTGTSGGPNGVIEYTLLFADKPPEGIDSEEVQLDVAPMPDGSSGIRADAQVVWLLDRPADETIPRTVDRLYVSAANQGKQIGRRTLTGGEARRLAQIVNALSVAARAEHSCAADTGYTLRVVAGPLVFAEDVACNDIVVTDGGKHLPVLQGSERFVHVVASSMGLPDYPHR